jgi:hypothetical protein
MEPKKLILPLSIVTTTDIELVLNEINDLKEYLLQMKIKSPDTEIKLPHTSKSLNNLLELNNLDLTNINQVDWLKKSIETLIIKAPIVHIGFSVEPNLLLLEKLVDWFRHNIDSSLLLTIGLQPIIGAGITLRTPNKFFDLSLKNHFNNLIPDLVKLIKEVN